MKEKKRYDKERADLLAQRFEKLTGVDIDSKSRIVDEVTLKALFWKILVDFNYMNDRNISEWYKDRGVSRNRSSIHIAMSKIDIYYSNYKFFRDVYHMYYSEEPESYKRDYRKRAVQKEKVTKVLKSYNEHQKDKLNHLIDSLPAEKRAEIYELVNLRVKSWDWKAKNEYEVIEGYNSLM